MNETSNEYCILVTSSAAAMANIEANGRRALRTNPRFSPDPA